LKELRNLSNGSADETRPFSEEKGKKKEVILWDFLRSSPHFSNIPQSEWS
jgi:hypothetical protein